MKKPARILLLFLWLLAITAPSVITLIDIENPVLVTNLNEEEQQELAKKLPVEEKIVDENRYDFSLTAQSKSSVRGSYRTADHIDYTLEILLPPPQSIF